MSWLESLVNFAHVFGLAKAQDERDAIAIGKLLEAAARAEVEAARIETLATKIRADAETQALKKVRIATVHQRNAEVLRERAKKRQLAGKEGGP